MHARSLVALGSALRRRGYRSESREPLVAGLELAHRCGTELLSAQAREELVVSGGRPRRVVRSGFDALTASERRIVRLAVGGASNGEIAQTLYVSVKTVEAHLSNAYRQARCRWAACAPVPRRGDLERRLLSRGNGATPAR